MSLPGADACFVVEIPLRWSRPAERVAFARVRAVQRLANDVLREFLGRADQYRRDRDYARLRAERDVAIVEGRIPATAARAAAVKKRRRAPVPEAVVPRAFAFANAAERSRAWQALRDRHGLCAAMPVAKMSDDALAWYTRDKAWVRALTAAEAAKGDAGIGAAIVHHEIVAGARRRVLDWILGGGGRPRFASRRHPRTSVSGSSSEHNAGSMRVDLAQARFRWGAAGGAHVLIGNLVIHPDDAYLHKALRREIRQVRVLYRIVGCKRRWYVQLCVAGTPPVAPRLRAAAHAGGVLGIDLGAQHVAAVALDPAGAVRDAWIEPLAPTPAARERARDRGVLLPQEPRKRDRYLRRVQRQASRAMRRNPANAHAVKTVPKTLTRTRDGRAVGKVVQVPAGWKRGAKVVRSERVRDLLAHVAEVQRADSAARDADHGATANRMLVAAQRLQLEQLSYLAWQRAFGRSARRRAPGALVARIKRRAPLFGVDVVDLPTSTLKLSQLCHACGAYTRQHGELSQPIAQRIARCAHCDREPVQRDGYSAFLAAFVAVEGSSVDCRAAQAAWPGAGRLLGSALQTYESGRRSASSDAAACASSAPGRSTSTIARHPSARRLRSATPEVPRAVSDIERLGEHASPQDRSTSVGRSPGGRATPLEAARDQGRVHPLETCEQNVAAIGSG